MKGNSSEARILNNYLDALQNKVYLAEREMILDGLEITFQSFKDKWFGSAQRTPTILELFREHNEEVALLLGKDFAPGTLERYKTSFDHTANFIQWKYGCTDIQIDKFDSSEGEMKGQLVGFLKYRRSKAIIITFNFFQFFTNDG